MKTKIICILVMTLFIATALQAVGTMNIEHNNYILKPCSESTIIWSDDFDSYAAGSPLHGQGGWDAWDLKTELSAYVSNSHSQSSPNSIEANWWDDQTWTDMVHLFYGVNSGQWTISAWWFIPEEFKGISSLNLFNKYEHNEPHYNTQDCSVRVRAVGEYNEIWNLWGWESCSLIRDKWVEIRVEIDFELDTYDIYYNNTFLASGSWTRGMGQKNLACINPHNEFSYSTSSYFDDFTLEGDLGEESDLATYEEMLDLGSVKPGETASGSFIVQNEGISGLDWEIESTPEWGEEWSFDPNGGTDLGPYDPVKVIVEVIAPDTKDDFTGELKIVNSENPDDYEIIDVTLTTPRNRLLPNRFLLRLFERFPNAFPLLQLLFQ